MQEKVITLQKRVTIMQEIREFPARTLKKYERKGHITAKILKNALKDGLYPCKKPKNSCFKFEIFTQDIKKTCKEG